MSVRKREWTTRRGEQREAWILDYSVNGARHIETFERKKDADARAGEVTVSIGKGVHIAPSKTPTVSEAGKLWLDALAADIERTTADTYRAHLQLHIYPYLGPHRLAHLTPKVVRQFMDDLRAGKPAPFPTSSEKPHDSFKQNRSPAMVKKIVTTLGNMLADMTERGLVAMNAVHSLRKNRKRGKERQAELRKRGKLKVGVDIPAPAEITKLIAHLPDKWRPLFLTAIFTGLRISELRGLKWEAVDLKKAKLDVQARADKYRTIGKPKSAAGERTVPLPPKVVNMLREHRLKSAFKTGDDFVFPTSEGTGQDYGNIFRRGFVPTLVAAGLVDKHREPKYTIHALRHFYASWCINREKDGGLELPLKMVQERMGHSSITITANIYGHLFPTNDNGDELKDAEQKLWPV
jgi:integrase